jgi:hypothetical protein
MTMSRALGRGNPPLFKGQGQAGFTVCVTYPPKNIDEAMFYIAQSVLFLYNECTTASKKLYNVENRINAGARGRNRTGTPCGGGF